MSLLENYVAEPTVSSCILYIQPTPGVIENNNIWTYFNVCLVFGLTLMLAIIFGLILMLAKLFYFFQPLENFFLAIV